MGNIKVGINVVVLRDGRLLLGRRKNVFGAGEWGLPGGHLELGEKFEAAAARELWEETGLRAERYEFANLVNQPRGNSEHYIQIGFVGINVTSEPELKEPERCEEWKWFAVENLPENLFSAHREQIQLFLRGRLFQE